MKNKTKEKNKKKIKIKKLPILLIIFLLILSVIVYAEVGDFSPSITSDFSPSAQYYRPSFQTYYTADQIRDYWPMFQREDCRARQDFILTIRPGGCQPAVVRSDLLEDQPVPVFCKVDAIKVNPLIDVESIKSISFTGRYPSEISGAGFHPARAAIRTSNILLGSPLLNNVGYIVLVLKRQQSEKEMPDSVEGTLTARIHYDIEKAFGVGRAEFFLPVLTDREWENNYEEYSFWRGKGFLRANWIEPDKAAISVYNDAKYREASSVLEKGKFMEDVYLGGFYCKVALNVKLKDITYPETRAKITVKKEGEENVLWLYERSDFLDNKCKVTEINPVSLGGGSVKIKCREKEFTLRLGIASSINLGGAEREIWNIVEEEKDSKIYFAYVGQIPRKIKTDEAGRTFIVLIKTKNELNEETKITLERKIKIILENHIKSDRTKEKFEQEAEKAINSSSPEIQDTDIVFYNEKSKFNELKFEGAAGSSDIVYESDEEVGKEDAEILEKYFDKAISEYRKVVQLYPAEQPDKIEDFINDLNKTYGEASLDAAKNLANQLGKQKTKQELLREIISNYPNTKTANESEKELVSTLKYNSENAIETIGIGFDYYTFHLQDIIEPSQEEASATISVDGKEGIYTKEDYLISPSGEEKDGKEKEYIQLEKLEEEYVILNYNVYKDDKKTLTGNKKERVKKGQLTSIGNYNVYVSDIKLLRMANVIVEPKLIGPYTEANLSYKIGIEKRGIRLSPEKTKEMIDNLNESIEKWQGISEKLAKVVKGWKGVCFATSAVLMIKNLIDNFSGKSIARQKVMRGDGGWINRCKDMVAKGEKGYVSLDACLYGERESINKDVSAAQQAIEKVNQMMKSGEVITKESVFGEKILDTEKSFEGFMAKFQSEAGSDTITFTDENGKTQSFKISELIEDYSKAYEDGIYTFSDVREWKYYNDMIKNSDISEGTRNAYRQKLSEIYKEVSERRKDMQTVGGYKVGEVRGGILSLRGRGNVINTHEIIDLSQEDINKFEIEKDVSRPTIEQNTKKSFIRIQAPSGLPQNLEQYAGKIILVPLSRSRDEYNPFGDAYLLESVNGKEKLVEKVPETDLNALMKELRVSKFVKIEKGKCKNEYKKPEVRFHEVEPYKGLPGVVPFDIREGWYVGTKQIIKGFGLTPYTDAALLKNFYLCNVGKNAREEFDSGLGDDICSFISYEIGASPSHPCLTDTEARAKVEQARRAVMEAAQQYAKGIKKIMISGQEYSVGVPLGGAEGTQCQDYMSPEDCYLLFNTCDPVLCPISRCNLGGAYPVRDVVQSGIIGSIALCLPNAREGIFVPVCLTGIQAGLDAYISILKSHRDCLQESLETGKTVGICDEIYSIYLCEFFWRQFAPLMDVALPKLVELAYGKGTRGGGEYATITHAWNTLDNSINYFTNFYAQNSFKAFQIRSTDEAGSEICKSFISARYPSNKKFFDALLEPESPVQYHAWFSEIPFTEATIPSTSHYKVFYHIWAGNDQGAHYYIYLKNPPESSYYATMSRIVVDSGYVARGGYVSETRDFTAPAGYKNLCVRVNLQEECGFGQVSTSFAIDYLKEQYAADQAKQQITTEKECMSGTPSLYALAQPNIQEGIYEAARPEAAGTLYKKGIIRICSTDNPGKQTAPDRWKNIGYCDDEKLRCWLDLYSVEANIRNNNTLTEVMQGVKDIDEKRREELLEKGELMSEEQTNSIFEEANTKINDIIGKVEINEVANAEALADNIFRQLQIQAILNKLEEVEDRGFLNSYKAKAIFLKGQIYDEITRKIHEKFVKSTYIEECRKYKGEIKKDCVFGCVIILSTGSPKEEEIVCCNITCDSEEREKQKGEISTEESRESEELVCEPEATVNEPQEIGAKVKDKNDLIWTRTLVNNKYLWVSAAYIKSWKELEQPIFLCKKGEEVEAEAEEKPTINKDTIFKYETDNKVFYLKYTTDSLNLCERNWCWTMNDLKNIEAIEADWGSVENLKENSELDFLKGVEFEDGVNLILENNGESTSYIIE